MPKGVKRIKIIKGAYNPKTEVLGEKITVNFDQNNKEILFLVSEWFEHTTPKEKQGQVRWFVQNEKRTILKKEVLPSSSPFHFTIEKKLCGNYLFYVEASLSDNRANKGNTGVYIQGKCQAKIVSTKWARESEGKSIKNNKKQDYICYGHPVFLHLETEGLNNHNLTIEIWNRRHFLYDNEKICSYSNVMVKDGRVILAILDTFNWKSRVKGMMLDVEEFFIKVKDNTTNKYIKNDKGDDYFATFLNIKNKVVSSKTEPPKSITPSKVGELDKNKESYHTCRFKEIIVKDNDEYFTVFKDGKTSSKKVPAEKTVKNNVYFDFDKSDIRSDAKNILNDILEFLLFNQHLEMVLTGHADDRGSLDYNQALSERRAKAVKDFFVSGGLDPNRIKISGKGESEPAAKGNTEEAYQKNRRVEIDFRYFEYNQDALIYETIAGNSLKYKKLEIKIGEWSDKACFRNPKHQKNTVIVKKFGQVVATKKESQFSQLVFAKHENFPNNYFYLLVDFLNPKAIIYTSEAYRINSCAYFANPNKATLEVRTYPDVVWIGHFQYNYGKEKPSYYFHQKEQFSDLTIGITDVLNELKQSIFYKIWAIVAPLHFILEQLLINYIEEQAKDFVYGLHTIHNRTLEKKGTKVSLVGKQTNIIKETSYTRYLAAAAIYELVAIGIIIDLLLIYLTRGKNLGNKLKKISKMARNGKAVLKKLDDAGVELIPPSIAINAGMYYQKQENGKVALIYEANLKADPILAVNFKREFNLLELLQKGRDINTAKYPKANENKENNKLIVENFKKKNVFNIIGNIEIRGDLIFEDNVRYNMLTNTYTFDEKMQNLKTTKKDERTLTEKITFKAMIEVKFRAEFTLLKIKTKVEAEAGAEINGEASLKLKYGVNKEENKSFFVDLSLHCSGIKGTYWGKINVENSLLGKILEYPKNKEKEKVPFTLIEGFDLPISKVELFKSQA